MSGTKVIWVSFNAGGAICSVTDKEPTSIHDQWDNAWVKMVPE